jgi:hypothetical protein
MSYPILRPGQEDTEEETAAPGILASQDVRIEHLARRVMN